MRLAWFTPLPPVRSGISQYSRELLPALAQSHSIDVFVEGPPDRFEKPPGAVELFDAYDFVWKQRENPYDLVVYQLGNARCHDYMWAYLVRFPGLLVLHDGQLHHARARYLLQQKKPDDYRRELWFDHPDANPDVAELGIQGLLGTLTYFWPMLRTVMESARHVVVHNEWLAAQLREGYPDTSVSVIEMGVPESKPRPNAREIVRARHGIRHDAVLFVAIGKVTPEKRIRESIRALAAMSEPVPNAHLLLAGEPVDHYDPAAEARGFGIAERVSIAGYLPADQIDDYLAAADVCLCLRWPTSRETSASWLRCLAAGRPALTSDLAHLADIPTVDARDGSLLSAGAPVGASVDILDEKHALGLGMRRLAQDAEFRDALGRNARELWRRRFHIDRMIEGYRATIELAAAAPQPSAQRLAGLPAHLRSAGWEHADRVLREAGFPGSPAAGVWTHHGE